MLIYYGRVAFVGNYWGIWEYLHQSIIPWFDLNQSIGVVTQQSDKNQLYDIILFGCDYVDFWIGYGRLFCINFGLVCSLFSCNGQGT